MFFCYLLRCSDGSLYAGFTTDLERRVKEHNQGKASKYPATRRPAELVWSEPRPTLSAARRREAQLKRWNHREKEALIAGFPQSLAQQSKRLS